MAHNMPSTTGADLLATLDSIKAISADIERMSRNRARRDARTAARQVRVQAAIAKMATNAAFFASQEA